MLELKRNGAASFANKATLGYDCADASFDRGSFMPLRITDRGVRSLGDLRVALVDTSINSVSSPVDSRFAETVLPSLGLGYLSSSLRAAGLRDLSLIELGASKKPLRSLSSTRAHVVGLSATTPSVRHLASWAKHLREEMPSAVLIAGGPHITGVGRRVLDDIPELDYAITGESETSLAALLESLAERDSDLDIPGLLSRERMTPPLTSAPCMDLDALPFPAHDLFDFPKYHLSPKWGAFERPMASMITSRGCPYRCAYCRGSETVPYRSRSVESVLEEVDLLVGTYGVRTIAFWDDTFTFDADRTSELCEALARRRVGWYCNTRADRVPLELLSVMQRSGCKAILFGVESLDPGVLASLGRNMTTEDLSSKIAAATTLGIRAIASIMIGSPNDTVDSIMASAELAAGLPTQFVRVSIYNTLPGTTDYTRALEDGGLHEPVAWGSPESYPGPPLGVPTHNPLIGREELQRLYLTVRAMLAGKVVECSP